jgi:Flp pilus assembly protein TadG
MTRRGSLRQDRKAATAVEFALLGTALLWLVFGAIEFGRWMWTIQVLQAAAAEGARCMAVLNSDCASGGAYSSANTLRHVQSVARTWGLTLTSDQVTRDRAASIGGISGFSALTLTYSFQSVVSGFLPGLTGTSTLTAQSYVPNWQ